MMQQDTRSLEDVEEAIKEVGRVLMDPMSYRPQLVLVVPTILDVLNTYRRVIQNTPRKQ